MRVAVYMWISSSHQFQQSIEQQLTRLYSYAQSEDWRLSDDHLSCGDSSRSVVLAWPGLDRLYHKGHNRSHPLRRFTRRPNMSREARPLHDRICFVKDNWPSPQDLIGYVDSTLSESCRRFIEQYTQEFPEVLEEIYLLRQFGGNPLMSS